jgi:indole-3-glycerol phosphate synthase
MFLERIVAATQKRVAESKRSQLGSLPEELERLPGSPQAFDGALQGKGVKLIAEIKRASPSRGWLRPALEVPALVDKYMRGGAAAISVLTEPEFFRGSLEDLRAARQATDLPLLCKDFILDPFQIYQARAYGADAVLLIAAILSLPELSLLIQVAHSLGMAALVEVHNEEEARKALAAEAALIGINNRDLRDFSVTLETTLRIRPLIPSAVPVVSESGIRSREDVLALQEVGVNAILVGESLVTAPDPVAKIKELLGGEEEKP